MSDDPSAGEELECELPWPLAMGAQRLAAQQGTSLDLYIAGLIKKALAAEIGSSQTGERE